MCSPLIVLAAQVRVPGRTEFASNKALSISLQMEANPAPGEPSQCIAVTTRRPRCESTPPPQTTGNCFVFWFVRNRDEEPVKLELHRLADGTRRVRYDGKELAGDWLLGNCGHEDDPNVFICYFELEKGWEGVTFRFEQVKATNTYRFCGPRPEHDIFLVHLPKESW
jgi:hypothetical protein